MAVDPKRSVHVGNLPPYSLCEIEDLLFELFLQVSEATSCFSYPFVYEGVCLVVFMELCRAVGSRYFSFVNCVFINVFLIYPKGWTCQ